MRDRDSLRRFDTRSESEAKLLDLYSNFNSTDIDSFAFRQTQRMFASGIPSIYLEAGWEDYQASDRTSLDKAIKFAKSLEIQIVGGGGLVIFGNNGSGKSFLSYMIAITAMKTSIGGLYTPVVCFTVPEYLEKKAYQYLNPQPYDELLRMIDEAKLVVIDNLNRESEKLGWKPQDLFDMINRATNGRGNKAVVLNSNLSREEYEEQTGGSVLSRTRYFQKIALKNTDFRGQKADLDEVIKFRASGSDISKCFKPSMVLKRRVACKISCKTCAYYTRVYHCNLRITGKWKKLEQKLRS